MLRFVVPAVICLSLSLLGCQPAEEVPLNKTGKTPAAEQGHTHSHADGDHDHDHGEHGHSHAHGDHEHVHPEPGAQIDTPSSAKKGTDDKDVAEALKPADKASEKPMDEPKPSSKDAQQEKENVADIKKAAPLPTEVVLGEEVTLYEGIPGEDELSIEEINTWLARDDVHEELKISLPLGLSLGEGQIVGLDENPMTRAKIELGRQLYFDARLSSDNTISCASCHHPDTAWTAQTQFGVGVEGQEGNRNSPASYNRIVSGPQFWDGRAATLEEQAKGPIENPIEMANTHDVAVERVQGIKGYRVQFENIFGKDSINIDNLAKAIAAFERAVVTGPSPYDYYAALKPYKEQFTNEDLAELKDDDPELYARYETTRTASEDNPMSESAIRGMELFFDKKTGCTQCHVGANFTDEKYHNLGVGMDAEDPDLGRFAVTGKEADKGAFKTPTIRNVAQTAPYMHDGSQKTLEEVVDWYAKGGHPNPWLSEKVKKLELTDQDKADLVAFMKALSGPFPKVEPGRLPE